MKTAALRSPALRSSCATGSAAAAPIPVVVAAQKQTLRHRRRTGDSNADEDARSGRFGGRSSRKGAFPHSCEAEAADFGAIRIVVVAEHEYLRHRHRVTWRRSSDNNNAGERCRSGRFGGGASSLGAGWTFRAEPENLQQLHRVASRRSSNNINADERCRAKRFGGGSSSLGAGWTFRAETRASSSSRAIVALGRDLLQRKEEVLVRRAKKKGGEGRVREWSCRIGSMAPSPSSDARFGGGGRLSSEGNGSSNNRGGNRASVDAVDNNNASAAVVKNGQADESAEELVVPTEEFRRTALVASKQKYDALYKKSIEDPDSFWGEIASQFYWKSKWEEKDGKIHKENFDVRKGPVAVEWFKGGKTNICYNAVDRHLESRGDDVALIWEGNEPGYDSKLTFRQLKEQVCQVANYLRSLGVGKGDAVVIYMPMLMELPVAMLACARIGAVHSVVFAGFSAEALAQRILDFKPKVILTANAVMRGAKSINLKGIVDDSLKIASKNGLSIDTVLVYANDVAISRKDTAFQAGRDVWWQDVVPIQSTSSAIEWVDAEDPLFLLYTSGSTGKAKGVLHTTGGYMVWTATTFKYAFDYHPGDIFWCTADCGWITGHSYLTYGPLLNGATVVVFEGVPTYPDEGRCWEIVDKYNVSIFYTAPTAIRSLMRAGDGPVKKYSRRSLRVLGSVGEPINPSAWRWYHDVVGDGRCPISDTWWQTETGGFMITPIPGAWPLKPGSATFPFFGVQPAIVDQDGKELEGVCSGSLCLKASWPGTFRTLYGDHSRYETTYFAPFKGFYFSGDGCHRDKDGYYWLTGRVDDVINVSGHRIGSAEVESALVAHPKAAEAAVVGYDHQVKGQGIYAFVTLLEGVEYSEELRKNLVAAVRTQIGPFATPDKIHWAPGLPKTRSGKIMRRILRKIASNEIDQLGDVSTLADPKVVDQLIALRDK